MIVTKDCGFYGQVMEDRFQMESVVVLVAVHFLVTIKTVNIFSNQLEVIFKMASILLLLGSLKI